jgi:hypothetical protein
MTTRKNRWNHAVPQRRRGESSLWVTSRTQENGPFKTTVRCPNASMGVRGFEVCDALFKLRKFFIDFFGAVVMLVLRGEHAGTTARSHEGHHDTQDEANAF